MARIAENSKALLDDLSARLERVVAAARRDGRDGALADVRALMGAGPRWPAAPGRSRTGATAAGGGGTASGTAARRRSRAPRQAAAVVAVVAPDVPAAHPAPAAPECTAPAPASSAADAALVSGVEVGNCATTPAAGEPSPVRADPAPAVPAAPEPSPVAGSDVAAAASAAPAAPAGPETPAATAAGEPSPEPSRVAPKRRKPAGWRPGPNAKPKPPRTKR